MVRHNLGVVTLLPEPVSSHVQAWRRALDEPFRSVIGPHITFVPPQTVSDAELEAAIQLVRTAADATEPALIELDGAATFLPETPVTFLTVAGGRDVLAAIEQRLESAPLGRRTYAFHPHVTIAQNLEPAVLEQARRDLDGFRASFPLHEILLMEEQRSGSWLPIFRAAVGSEAAVREVAYDQASSVGVFFLGAAGSVLLGLRTAEGGRRYPGVWDALGGKPEQGESLLEGLAREVREEAGVEVLDPAPLGCFDDGERADAFFVATSWKGEPRNAEPTEHDRLEWMPLQQVNGLPLAPTTRRALDRLRLVLGGV